MIEIDDVPQGQPGRIAMCELCGKYVNNYQMKGDLLYCPDCGKPSLIRSCQNEHCGVPLPFPPQLKCLSCGEWLTIWPMKESGRGQFVPNLLEEPTAARRKQLEEKGNNWYDVIRGKAEGPTPELPDHLKGLKAPGFDAEQLGKLLHEALGEELLQEEEQAGEQKGVAPSPIYLCQHCHIKLRFYGNVEPICPVCNKQLDPPKADGVDTGGTGS